MMTYICSENKTHCIMKLIAIVLFTIIGSEIASSISQIWGK